jgi:hypothetical protein
VERIPFDVDDYVRRAQSHPCFICAIVAGAHDSESEQIVAEDDENLAFLSRYPTLLGTVLVAPKQHHEHVAPLPPDVPYREQQFHALMAENGVLPWTLEQAIELAARLRSAVAGIS